MVSLLRAPRTLRAPTPVDLSPLQRGHVHMAASLLLDYPGEEDLPARLAAVEQDLGHEPVPEPVAGALGAFLAAARTRGQRALAEHYVETFDRRRRCCLYLSYYAVGDTRQRGAALLAFKEALAAAGYETRREELPDYLPLVLEASARSTVETGDTAVTDLLLASHREGIEVLRAALVDAASPYAHLVEAVAMTLPRIDEATAQRVRALVAAGPPTETVGVTDVLPFPSLPVRGVPPAPTRQEVLS